MTTTEKRRALQAVARYLVPDTDNLPKHGRNAEFDFHSEVFNLIEDMEDHELEAAFPLIRNVLLGLLLKGQDSFL